MSQGKMIKKCENICKFLEENNLEQQGIFFQHLIPDAIPEQGIKLHISVKSFNDCMKLYKRIIPALIEYGASFKVLSPYEFNRFFDLNTTQRGKFITIYESKWNAMDFFQEYYSLLYEDAIPCPCEIHFGGRIYARYGNNYRMTITDPNTGNIYQDDRTVPVPFFIQSISLQQYIYNCTN